MGARAKLMMAWGQGGSRSPKGHARRHCPAVSRAVYEDDEVCTRKPETVTLAVFPLSCDPASKIAHVC
jgi:hypothetical protein